MNLTQFFSNWQYDPISSLFTLIVVPFLLYLFAIVKKPVLSGVKYLTLGFTYHISIILSKTVTASLSLRHYTNIQLAGPSKYLFVPALRDVHLETDKIFVPLVLERAGVQTGYDHTNFLNAGNRIVIIGDPGSGKSSIARRVFRDECRNAQASPRKSRFPVLLELRNIPFPTTTSASKLGDWLFEYIRNQVMKSETYDLGSCFDAYVKTVGLLLILDGLDEISTRYYAKSTDAINQCAERLQQLSPNNVVIITMRIQFFRQVRSTFSNTFPIVFYIKRFTPTDIYEFLWRWDFDPVTKIREVTRIYTDLTDRPTLREMCSNPLILSMYVAQDQASGHPIAPENRTDFYSRVVEELVIRRRAVQIGPVQGQTVIREQRQQILGRIAFEHLIRADEPANLLDWRRGVEATSQVTGLPFEGAEKHLRQLSIDTGLITEEREGEVFRFIHLTFCEYFCAFEAVQARPDGWKQLISAHRCFSTDPSLRTRLGEVLPFACALMARHLRSQAITDVVEYADQRILALALLETKAYDHEVWPRFSQAYAKRLLERGGHELGPDWLREVHLYMVVCSDAETASNSLRGLTDLHHLQDFFDILRKRDDGTIFRLIDSYAEQDAAAAFRVSELCQIDMLSQLPQVIIKHCDQPPFLTLLLDLALRQQDRLRTWTYIFAEAGLRSRAVANALSQSHLTLWAERATKVNREFQWFGRTVPKTPYTECVSVACSGESVQDLRNSPLVRQLRHIRGPRCDKIAILMPVAIAVMAASMMLIYYVDPMIPSIPTDKTTPHIPKNAGPGCYSVGDRAFCI
jgi:hypothetical protein